MTDMEHEQDALVIFARLAGMACYMAYVTRTPMVFVGSILRGIKVALHEKMEVSISGMACEFHMLTRLLGDKLPLVPKRVTGSPVVMAFTAASDFFYGSVLVKDSGRSHEMTEAVESHNNPSISLSKN